MEEKYTTSSIYKFKDDRWRAQFPYLENGIWHKKTQLLEHRGRDKGRSHKHRDAAMLEAESIRASLNRYRVRGRRALHGDRIPRHAPPEYRTVSR